MAESPFIIDVTTENFEQVMQASFETPVLLDFWASWCQPCLALTPILTRLAEEYQGKFLLGKLNTEEQQELAAHFGIRGIPNVKLFLDGQRVDEFTGALPENAVREFLDRYVSQQPDSHVADARALLQAGDTDAAVKLLTEALQADPDNARTAVALAQAHAAAGDPTAAQAVLDELPADEQIKPEAAALRTRLYFDNEIAEAPDMDDLEARLAANADDREALYQRALRKVVAGDYDAAVEGLLELMKKDRSFGDDAAREALVKVFELLGNDPRVGQYRSRMANLLY